MKKVYQMFFILTFGSTILGQTHRVGINTEEPKATLDIRKAILTHSLLETHKESLSLTSPQSKEQPLPM